MARLKFGSDTGRTLTYGAYTASGAVRTAAGTSLSEVSSTGYYTVVDEDIVTGDVVVVKEGTRVIGWGEYKPVFDDSTIITELDSILEDTGTTLPDTLSSMNTLIALDTSVASVVTADTVFTLSSGSTYDDAYNNMVVSIKDENGTGDVIERRITDYVGAEKKVTVDADFEFPIEVDDTVRIYLGAYSTATTSAQTSSIAVACADQVWDESESDHVSAGTFGLKLQQWRALER